MGGLDRGRSGKGEGMYLNKTHRFGVRNRDGVT